MAHTLIIGLGDVGCRLAGRLLAAGHRVTGVRRGEQAPAGVSLLRADVTAPGLELPAADYVVVLLTPSERGEAGYRHTFVDGTAAVLRALPMPPRRLFWASSTAVYGQDAGEWVDEASVTAPAAMNGRVLLAGERSVLASGLPATILRFGGLYGPGRHRLLHWVERGEPVLAEPPQWTNRLHVDDAAALLAHLIACDQRGEALAAIYNGVDDEPAPQHEVLAWLAAAMQRPAPPVTADASAGQGKRVRNARSRADGFHCRYPDYRAGYAQVLQARAAAGDLS